MGLSDLADGIETTTTQRDRGVATIDDTGRDLADRLAAVDGDLPCTAAAAATVVEAYAEGTSVGAAGRAAGVAPITAAKVLHRAGIDGIAPLGPGRRAVVADYVAGEVSRRDALALTDADDAEFALTAYVLTHDPIPEAAAAVRDVVTDAGDRAVAKRSRLADTMSDATDLR
ncbi:MAG: hypothetical protein ABEJ08_00915 [Halobacteriaceae archaeon]